MGDVDSTASMPGEKDFDQERSYWAEQLRLHPTREIPARTSLLQPQLAADIEALEPHARSVAHRAVIGAWATGVQLGRVHGREATRWSARAEGFAAGREARLAELTMAAGALAGASGVTPGMADVLRRIGADAAASEIERTVESARTRWWRAARAVSQVDTLRQRRGEPVRPLAGDRP